MALNDILIDASFLGLFLGSIPGKFVVKSENRDFWYQSFIGN